MKSSTLRSKVLVFLLALIPILRVKAQNYSQGLAAADTSRFSPNRQGGWQLFNSYVATYGQDSATLELILQHANAIVLTQEWLVGKITYAALIPGKEQIVPFNLMNTIYWLRIDTAGFCYLRLATGAAPTDDPFILPVKVFYHR
jgi:hypothetical protein